MKVWVLQESDICTGKWYVLGVFRRKIDMLANNRESGFRRNNKLGVWHKKVVGGTDLVRRGTQHKIQDYALIGI